MQHAVSFATLKRQQRIRAIRPLAVYLFAGIAIGHVALLIVPHLALPPILKALVIAALPVVVTRFYHGVLGWKNYAIAMYLGITIGLIMASVVEIPRLVLLGEMTLMMTVVLQFVLDLGTYGLRTNANVWRY